MLIAVTAKSSDPESEVDPRFGRAAYFHLIDTETGKLNIIENSQNVNSMQGAGIQSAEILAEKKTNILITGHCGPKAFQVLNAAGIKIIVGVDGKIKNAVDRFKNNELKYAESPDVDPHW
ncbi:MAG: dinitrogenase iron-molybdenum cofactor biosynthesis protein [candidate division Zixibacteria bacterium]|nr:dinitrogenase iron-molybdenum cofactor biosynthesis protein [candidate division Zixibacteria bacterium]